MSSYGKCIGFPINFPQYGKMQQNPWYGESPGNWYSCFSHSMVAFFPSDSHPMPYFSTWEIHGFPHKFPTVRETATKLMVWRKSGWEIDTHYFCHSMAAFRSSRPQIFCKFTEYLWATASERKWSFSYNRKFTILNWHCF